MNSKRKISSAVRGTGSDWKARTRNTAAPETEGSAQPHKFKKSENGVRKGLFQSPITITCPNGRKMVLKPLIFGSPKKAPEQAVTPQAKTIDVSTETDEQFLKPFTPHTPLDQNLSTANRTFTPETPTIPFNESVDIAQLPLTPQVSLSSVIEQKKVHVSNLISFSPIDEETPPNTLANSLVSPLTLSSPSSALTPTQHKLGSEEDFLKMEAMCKTPMAHYTYMSPLSSVCNLFQSNMLINSVKKQTENTQTKEGLLKELTSILQSDCEIDTMLSELHNKRQQNRERMLGIVNKLKSLDESKQKVCDDITDNNNKSHDGDKENNISIKRRSLRISKKNVVKTSTSPGGSPVVLKSGDLRKSTLTKSLVDKCQKYQIATPRINKGLEMYNKQFRSTCSSLLTPRINRKSLAVSPGTSSSLTNISLKVKEQCIMLQDTPLHK